MAWRFGRLRYADSHHKRAAGLGQLHACGESAVRSQKNTAVAILDDGGNLKAFSRMDGAPIPTIEMAQNKAYTTLLGVSTQDLMPF